MTPSCNTSFLYKNARLITSPLFASCDVLVAVEDVIYDFEGLYKVSGWVIPKVGEFIVEDEERMWKAYSC